MSQHLHIHHIEHWADGGPTSLENGCCLCSLHHTLVHEGGYRIELAANNEPAADKQFNRQQSTNKNPELIESLLRNSRASFDFVKSLSPTRFRFRVIDSNGRDIRDSTDVGSENLGSVDVGSVDAGSVDVGSKNVGSVDASSKSVGSTGVDFKPLNSANAHSTNVDSTGIGSKDINSTTVDYTLNNDSITKSKIAEASAHYGYVNKSGELTPRLSA